VFAKTASRCRHLMLMLSQSDTAQPIICKSMSGKLFTTADGSVCLYNHVAVQIRNTIDHSVRHVRAWADAKALRIGDKAILLDLCQKSRI
jgi:hypothetical protein